MANLSSKQLYIPSIKAENIPVREMKNGTIFWKDPEDRLLITFPNPSGINGEIIHFGTTCSKPDGHVPILENVTSQNDFNDLNSTVFFSCLREKVTLSRDILWRNVIEIGILDEKIIRWIEIPCDVFCTFLSTFDFDHFLTPMKDYLFTTDTGQKLQLSYRLMRNLSWHKNFLLEQCKFKMKYGRWITDFDEYEGKIFY